MPTKAKNAFEVINTERKTVRKDWYELVQAFDKLPLGKSIRLDPKNYGVTTYKLRGLVTRAMDNRRWFEPSPKPCSVRFSTDRRYVDLDHSTTERVRNAKTAKP